MKTRFPALIPLIALCGCIFLTGCITSTREYTPAELQSWQKEAESQELSGEHAAAAKTYRRLGGASKDQTQKIQCLYKEAENLLLAGKIHKSHAAFTRLLRNYTLFVPYNNIVESLRQLADCFEHGKGTFLGISDEYTASKIYDLIVTETPAVHVSLHDRLKLAELLLATDRPEEAANHYYDILRKEPQLHDLRLKFAALLMELSRQSDGDGRKLRAAVREANIFLANTPEDHPGRPQAQEILQTALENTAARLLTQAKFYLQKRHRRPEAARRYLHDICKNFPDTSAAAEARELLRTEFQEE
jgi:tetratricopeptide (TPR) repeat protein